MKDSDVVARAETAIDALVRAGGEYHGLFPSMLNRRTGKMLMDAPGHIEGQRDGDRSYRGSNLIHDESTLKVMYALSKALGRDDYAAAADRYLKYFAEHCANTDGGLFPWGEHSYWHLLKDCAGCSHDPERTNGREAIHDHLRQTPLWLWEKLYEFNPRCVERFAEGIDNHWTKGDPPEYCRHACIERKVRLNRGKRSCDFPRHSGFYIFDLAFAYLKTGRTEFAAQIERFLEYWWEKRDERGILLIESRSPETDTRFYQVNAPAQTVSLATSLLESAQLLHEALPGTAVRMREYADTYTGGFFNAPHDLPKGVFVILSSRATGEVTRAMPVWGSVYGVWPASYVGLTCLCAYRIGRDERLLNWAEAVGHAYATEPFNTKGAVPAMDAGLGLGLLADLYDITGERTWLDAAQGLSRTLAAIYFDDAPLPRTAAGIDWYESQMGPGFLLHGLTRTAMLASGDGSYLDADYTGR